MGPKILFLDIETAPNIAYVWGLFDQNISHEHLETSSYILCWSAKWNYESEITYASIQKDKPKEMLCKIHRLLDEADIIVHYNGTKFDIPTLNKEFIKHKFAPPAPYKQVDLLRVCRQVFRFESNKMDAVLKSLNLGEKVKHRGFSLWTGCMKGDKKCWQEMERYNRHDVKALAWLYKEILPWITQHPNVAIYYNHPACTNCGSIKVVKRGKQAALTIWYQRYQCQACGHWFKGKERVKG